MTNRKIILAIIILILSRAVNAQEKWTAQKANTWYAQQPWFVGCNYTPANAINQLEMWQAETFDTATINKELGYFITKFEYEQY